MHWIDVRVCDNEIGYGMHKNMLCHACWNLYYINVVVNVDN